jgi:hypothetical protein
MPTIRYSQKEKIKEILEVVLPDLTITTYFATANQFNPYIYITSAELVPNNSGSTFDSGSYLRLYRYNIVCAFDASLILDQTSVFEDYIDEIEEKIMNVMQLHSTRSNNANLWNDLECGTFSAFSQNDEPETSQSIIFKTLPITCETQVEFDNSINSLLNTTYARTL